MKVTNIYVSQLWENSLITIHELYMNIEKKTNQI